MRAAFAELEAAGYLHRRRSRGERGQFVTELHLFDRPVTAIPNDALLPDRDTASGMPVPPAETQHQPRSDRGTASGTPVDAGRGTGSGTLEPPETSAETSVCPGRTDIPLTDRRRAVPLTEDGQRKIEKSPLPPDGSPGMLTLASHAGEIDHEQAINGAWPTAAHAYSDDAALVRLAQDELEQATGIPIDDVWAAKSVRLILDGANGSVRNPAAYIRDAIRNAPDPKTRFYPITRAPYSRPRQEVASWSR
jgi:hypothetical protein